MMKDITRLKGKKVEIHIKPIGTAVSTKSYKGEVLDIYTDGNTSFIELDIGELINTKYIATITIIN